MTGPQSQPRLETARLILRPPVLDDLDRWAEMVSDPDVTRFIGGVMPKPVAWRALMQTAGAWTLTGVAMFSVLEKSTGRWVGRVGPWQPFAWPGTEVGWALHRDAWGKGYAYEAATAAIDYAFDTLGWTHVIHCINPQNEPSRALARRLGSSIERQTHMPPPFEHEVVDVWGQSREAWRARRASLAPRA